jgi:parallel beta-helix repeat protein
MKMKLLSRLLAFILTLVMASASYAARGPQPGVTPPVGAREIYPGSSIQSMIDAFPTNTTFFIKAGIHYISHPITPKTGNTFIGEYGAILDGSNGAGWTLTDDSSGAFRAWNENIDYVTIKNLVIRNMPKKGIAAYYWMADHWTIDHNEIAYNFQGLNVGNDSVVSFNYIHHNVGIPGDPDPGKRGGGYGVYGASNVIFDNNEIAYNGPEQKTIAASDSPSANITFRNNWVHHNSYSGIWFDGLISGTGLVENNIVEDNPVGIHYEVSPNGIIRNNIIRRSSDSGIFMSTSRDSEIYGNILENNSVGICYMVNLGLPSQGYDLKNLNSHDNTITVPSTANAAGSVLTYTAGTESQFAPYLNGSKNLVFQNNHYFVPSLPSWSWIWGSRYTWEQWQTIPQDGMGSVQLTSASASPVITTQPANRSVMSGQTATFSVMASGSTPLSYQWQKNGTNISGATTATYTTSATTSTDNNSTFRVIVSNSYGSVTSASATLTVTSGGTYTLVATPSTVVPGATLSVNWTAPSGGADYYDWIGFYRVGESSELAWIYTQGVLSGTWNVTVPTTEGQYEFRYFLHHTATRLATSNTVTAKQSSVSQVMHIARIDMSFVAQTGGTIRAVAKVFVVDQNGAPIPSVTVNGTWSGLDNSVLSKTTGTGGMAQFSTSKSKRYGTWIFTVTGMSKTGYTYNQSQNVETSDSITR